MFLVIYILTCIEQIIDSTDVQLWVIRLIEIKNIFLYWNALYFNNKNK